MSEQLQSVPTQTPLVGLKMDSDTAHYVGILEGTVAALVVNEMKYRALLELYTGESFEATRIGTDGRALIDLAVSTLVKQTGMDLGRAKILVLQRWNQFNQATPVIPQAVSPEALGATVSETQGKVSVTHTARKEMSQRYQDWVQRQRDSAQKVQVPDDTEDVATQ